MSIEGKGIWGQCGESMKKEGREGYRAREGGGIDGDTGKRPHVAVMCGDDPQKLVLSGGKGGRSLGKVGRLSQLSTPGHCWRHMN